MNARLILDDAHSGPWNMAVDEALLESAAAHGAATLRIYGWSEPTLSLGYFQSYRERETHRASAACPLVRRSSGGGAILHDRELTYSLALPIDDRLADNVQRLVSAVHGCLVATLLEFEISGFLGTAEATKSGDEPFLCFQRRAEGDVLLGQHKICGSAQRRRRNAVLQHGSILWKKSNAAPELPGIEDLTATAVDREVFLRKWLAALGSALNLDFQPGKITAIEAEVARNHARNKYEKSYWNARRK